MVSCQLPHLILIALFSGLRLAVASPFSVAQLQSELDNEIIDALNKDGSGGPYVGADESGTPNIPGLKKEADGSMTFNGEKVKSVSAINDGGMSEVLNMEEVRSKEPISRMENVKSMMPVSRMDEVINKDAIKSMEPLKSVQPLKSVDEVSNIEEVISKQEVPEDIAKKYIKELSGGGGGGAEGKSSDMPVVGADEAPEDNSGMGGEKIISKQELNSVMPVDLEEVLKQTPIKSMEELKSVMPLKSVEEVISMQEVVNKKLVPEEVAREFIKELEGGGGGGGDDFPKSSNRALSNEPAVGADEVDSPELEPIKKDIEQDEAKIGELKSKLKSTLGEVNGIEEVLKKHEVSHLDEVQSIRELKTKESIKRMEEVRTMEEVRKMDEVLKIEEVLSKELVKSMTPIKSIQEVKKYELTKEQADELKKLIGGGK